MFLAPSHSDPGESLLITTLLGVPLEELAGVDSQNSHMPRPTGLTGLVCIVRVELGFFKESLCNPTREGVHLPRPINIKAKAD